ncbi:MAG: hypothetical protein M9894_24760 [Planctomycetes bacterium]|nr:hypothetical protein [Planctomycetota bacterium]
MESTLGARGEARLLAIEALERGRVREVDRAVLEAARRAEEAALARAPLGPLEREVARRYLERVRHDEEEGR